MWNLLKKIVKRKKDNMENIEEIDIEILDNELKPFLYKWTKGDNSGSVSEYESVFKDPTTGIIWINFRGGTRINYNLLNEYMMQIEPSAIIHNEPISQNNLPIKNVMLPESKARYELTEDHPLSGLTLINVPRLSRLSWASCRSVSQSDSSPVLRFTDGRL